MNIFVLDLVPRKAAQYHCDSHANKMVLESAQLLSTCHRVLRGVRGIVKVEAKDGTVRETERWLMPEHGERSGMWAHERGPLYWASHENHPCGKWLRTGNAARYRWLFALYVQLGAEYTHRFEKQHMSMELEHVLRRLPRSMRDDSHLQSYDVDGFALAMPDEYKDFKSAVQSYRDYYVGEKQHLAVWTKREQPGWWK